MVKTIRKIATAEVEPDAPIRYADFFAGGGGASKGLSWAGWLAMLALNHSPVAIATHKHNFPYAKHLLCDIRKQSEWKVGVMADVMWASPDCTHHSIAKGGQSRDAKERALAEELPRFALALNVNCIMIENVSQFLTWGPVQQRRNKRGELVFDKKGEPIYDPIKERKSEYYNHWLEVMKKMGFVNYEYRILNAADFGAPQSRKRYFGIFTRAGIKIKWPKPTHDRDGKGKLPTWLPVRDVLDLGDRGRSIFTQWDQGKNRKPGDKPADKTLRRILAGLKKHVIGAGESEVLVKRTGTQRPEGSVPGTNPSSTIATCYLPDLLTPAFIHKNQSNPPSGKPGVGASINRPSDVIAASWHPDLVTAEFVANPAWGGASASSTAPSPTIVARQDKGPLGLVSAEIMVKSYGGDPTHQSYPLSKPASTITTADHHNLATAYLMHNYGGENRGRSLDEPSATITGSGGQQYLTHFYSGRGQTSAMCAPHPCLTTQPKSRLLTPVFVQQHNGGSDNCRVLSLEGPVNTVTTENRFSTVQVEFLAQSNGVSEGTSPAAKTWPSTTASRTITAQPNQSLLTAALLQSNGTRADDDAARLTMSLDGQAPTVTTNGGNLYLMTYYGNGTVQSLCRPCPTLTTHDRVGLLGFLTPSHGASAPYSLRGPAKTIVASRRHQYLVLAAPGSPVAHEPGDSEAMRLLKAYCRRHGIADIYMRMLKVEELKLIMGFPADYYLAGSDTKKKEMLGNAVVPQIAEALARAMTPSLRAARKRKLRPLCEATVHAWEQLD
jgi:DNA (cytosine-5)-methyltransferase 1